jgi:hypothetical protein
VSDWTYVTIAYVVVWGSLTVYGVTLARRVSAARQEAKKLQQTHRINGQAAGRSPPDVRQEAPAEVRDEATGQETVPCDTPLAR